MVFATLMLVRKKIKIRGGLFALYVTLYGFGRFWIEGLRTDSLWLGNMRVSQGLSELLVFGGIAYLIYMYFSKREFYHYSGYYSLGLTETQIDAMKGKNALLNAQRDLKRAKWFADIVREDSLTSPRYRAVKEKAEMMEEKAKKLRDELGEESGKVKAAQKRADALAAKAKRIYAQIKLDGRLEAAQKDADKAAALVESLKKSDPDSPDLMDAQKKSELANLLVEKIKDSIEENKKNREEWLEKAELSIDLLEDKVKRTEEELSEKKEEGKDKESATEEKPEKEEVKDKASPEKNKQSEKDKANPAKEDKPGKADPKKTEAKPLKKPKADKKEAAENDKE